MTKALFLDRDGVINVDKGYVYKIEDIEFIQGIFEFCKYFQDRGYLIFIVTNQSGIARGYFTEQQYQEARKYIEQAFQDHGITISETVHCPHLDGPLRKPNPGMFKYLISKYNIDVTQSISIGDKTRDIVASKNANVKTNVLFDGNFQHIIDQFI